MVLPKQNLLSSYRHKISTLTITFSSNSPICITDQHTTLVIERAELIAARCVKKIDVLTIVQVASYNSRRILYRRLLQRFNFYLNAGWNSRSIALGLAI